MIETIKTIVTIIYGIVCVALIIIAILQTKDSDGASSTITGAGSNNFYEHNKGRTKTGKLKRWTIILGVAFIVLAIILGILMVM